LRVETPCTYISAKGDIERLLGARPLLQGAGIEAAAAHLGDIKGQFADAGHHRFGLEAIGVIGALGSAFMGLGMEKVVALDPARFVDQNAQRFAGAIQTVIQQRRKSRLQRVMFYALCHAVDSFLGKGKNAPEEIACGYGLSMFRRAAVPSSAPRALHASALQPAQPRKTNSQRIYRRDVALTSVAFNEPKTLPTSSSFVTVFCINPIPK
jgi:hypothetical protein